MVDYVRIASLSQRLVEDNGRPMIVRRIGRTPTDTNKPWRGSATPRASAEVEYEETIRGVYVEPYSLIRYGFTANDVEDMRRYDVVVIFASKSFTDLSIDAFGMNEIEDDGVIFSDTYIRQLKPGEIPLLYVIGAKR